MLPELLQRVSLFQILHKIDQDLAEQCRLSGCPYCRGALHQASYLRKPRGGPKSIPEEYMIRMSLCCGRKNCRRRVLPPSCLFMGRKVYWRAVIVVVTSLRQARKNSTSINALQRMFAVSRKTIVRWIHYFRNEFASSKGWQRLRGLLPCTVSNDNLPSDLLNCFFDNHPNSTVALIHCLNFLSSDHAL